MPLFQNLPLVERSHIYERVKLDEYYQNIIVTHLDFWYLTPLDGVSGSVIHYAHLKASTFIKANANLIITCQF